MVTDNSIPKTTDEVAAEARVTPQTVRRWIAVGWLRAHRLGKQYRISQADYSDFLSRNATRAPTQP